MARLKEALEVDSYAELGRLIGLSTSAYANRKRADSIPYESIIPLAHSRSVSLDWLMFGESVAPNNVDETRISAEIDPDLLSVVFVGLQQALDPEMDAEEREELGRLAGLAAVVYNRVVHADLGDARADLLKREAKDMAYAIRLISASATKSETSNTSQGIGKSK
jgi:hypothetical protein